MRIAMFTWETLHSMPVGGVATHVTELGAALERRGHEVHIFTRPGYGTGGVSRIDGVWTTVPTTSIPASMKCSTCAAPSSGISSDGDHIGRFDIIHSHDWLASNAMLWVKDGRPDHRLSSRCARVRPVRQPFHNGVCERIRVRAAGHLQADRVIAAANTPKGAAVGSTICPTTRPG
jgi:glycosyltransferase involved in cell wall biosynthesis